MIQFQRRGDVGQEFPVVIDNDQAFDLRSLTADIDGDFLASDGLERARTALAAGVLEHVDVDGLRIGAPVARPSAVICIGQNYAAHAAETGDAPPTNPIIFFKHPNTVVGPDDDVVKPRRAQKLDWEVELAVVIGREASFLDSPERADEHIAGYAMANDVSERHFQIAVSGGQWSKGKSFPGFCPLGPSLVPRADLAPLGRGLGLRSWVNGEPRQNSTTDDMIFDVATLVYDLSQVMTLSPGDIVSTGTPQGVGASGRFPFLSVGDVVSMEIDGLGTQRQRIVEQPGA